MFSFFLNLTTNFSVTADRRLERNPDKSGAGYLTIPLSITSRFPNAVEHYSQVLHEIDAINVSSIEISATDGFFRSNFSKIALPEEICRRADLSFSYNPQEDVLHVECRSANNLSQCFPIVGTKTDEIVQWISHLDQPRTSFIVNYQLQGENYHRCPKGVVSGLPEGWQCESHGGASAGPDHIEGQWKCHGPTSTKNDARKAIEQFYKSASIDISASTIIIDEN